VFTVLCALACLQVEAVPSKARTIAESATTSILFQQTLALQEELLAKEKTIGDMQAGLMMTCGALGKTNYMDPVVSTSVSALAQLSMVDARRDAGFAGRALNTLVLTAATYNGCAAASVVVPMQGPVRAQFAPDTLQVLDMMISSTAAEANMLDQVHAAAAAVGAVQPHTQIEELH
jgi:hypothetical protein